MALFVVLQQIPESFIFLLGQKAGIENFMSPVFKQIAHIHSLKNLPTPFGG
jgi:hypothetical protein